MISLLMSKCLQNMLICFTIDFGVAHLFSIGQRENQFLKVREFFNIGFSKVILDALVAKLIIYSEILWYVVITSRIVQDLFWKIRCSCKSTGPSQVRIRVRYSNRWCIGFQKLLFTLLEIPLFKFFFARYLMCLKIFNLNFEIIDNLWVGPEPLWESLCTYQWIYT